MSNLTVRVGRLEKTLSKASDQVSEFQIERQKDSDQSDQDRHSFLSELIEAADEWQDEFGDYVEGESPAELADGFIVAYMNGETADKSMELGRSSISDQLQRWMGASIADDDDWFEAFEKLATFVPAEIRLRAFRFFYANERQWKLALLAGRVSQSQHLAIASHAGLVDESRKVIDGYFAIVASSGELCKIKSEYCRTERRGFQEECLHSDHYDVDAGCTLPNLI